MPTPTVSGRVNLAQIAQLAWTGRAAVANWRRHHADFPPAVGGTEISPTFERAAAVDWLRTHGRLIGVATPTASARAEARLTGLQLVRALMPGVQAGAYVNRYERHHAPPQARATLGLLREHTQTADTLTDIAPLVLELGYLTASGLVTLHQYDRTRVDAWLDARTRTARTTADEAVLDIGARADLVAVDIARIATEAVWTTDRDAFYAQHADRAARRLWGEYGTGEHGPRVRYALALAAGWLTAFVLAPALGDNSHYIDAHLEALAHHIIDNPTQ